MGIARTWSFLKGAMIGAGLMYLLDEHSGGRRRALIRDKMVLGQRKLRIALNHVHVFESSDVACDGIVGNNFAQQAAHDLAAAGFGQGVGETDLFGPGESTDFVGHPLAQFFA